MPTPSVMPSYRNQTTATVAAGEEARTERPHVRRHSDPTGSAGRSMPSSSALDGYADHLLRRHKQALFRDLPPTVVELEPKRGRQPALPGARDAAHRRRAEPCHARLAARAGGPGADRPRPARHRRRTPRPARRIGGRGDLQPRALHGSRSRRRRLGGAPHPAAEGRYAFLEHVAAAEGTAGARSGPCAGRGAGPSKAARASETCAP